MKYRRIEVNAFRRRVTVVSGEWPIVDIDDLRPAQVDDDISLNDTDSCEPVTPDSHAGQLIIVEAVRSLEQRLSPEARAARCTGRDIATTTGAKRSPFYLSLQSFYQLICRRRPRSFRKEK